MNKNRISSLSVLTGIFCLSVVGLSSCSVDSSVTKAASSQKTMATQLHRPQSPMPEAFYHANAAELKRNFKQPPDAVKPWVYWYWINDHISKTGIENDLAAMQKAGISTALIGIIHLQPSIAGYGEVTALTDEWWGHLRFAIEKAADYNVDIGLFNSPGWSQSGGPWVSLEQSMRYLDANEYQITGGSAVNLSLTKPEGFHQDVRVIAFQTPAKEHIRLNIKQSNVVARFDTENGEVEQADVSQLIDGNKQSIYQFPTEFLQQTNNVEHKANAKLHFDFSHQQLLEARSLEIFPHNTFSAQATLLAKNDRGIFEEIETFVLQRPREMASIGPDHDAPIVINFPTVSANEFRLTLSNLKVGRKQNTDPAGIKEIVLSSGYKLERFVEKKLAKVHPTPQPKHDSYQWPAPEPIDNSALAIKGSDVLDITQFVDNDNLHWRAPAGQWTLVHYFMRTTGTTNGPSSKSARGPEIDKLSKAIAQFHFDAYVGEILKTMQPQQRTALKYVVVDSYEQGAQNWTDEFVEKFKQQYGYDPTPYLTVYTGRVVNSPEQSERFLWDIRRLVADKVAYQYTAGLRERAHQHGLKLWLENYGHWGFPGEFLQYGGQADIVSGEFWASGNLGAIELKAASSAAHMYGHKTVMSESFTAGRSDSFINHPWNFKKRGDWSFVEGINHTLLHVYIQQAYDDKFPGVNAWFGSEFNRNNTWFDYMDSWLDYIKRANYMMQQGHYVADVVYFIGEDTPKMTGELNPAVPQGYSYDFINAEVILNGLTVNNGEFVLPSGMTFKLLVLPDSSTMRPAVLAKIKQLVAEGGAIYGPKPQKSPSLQNFPETDRQVQQMANELWQKIDGSTVTQTSFAKGQVFYSVAPIANLAQVLNQLKRSPDVADLPDSVIWSHRSSDTHEIYFFANQTEQTVKINPTIRLEPLMGHPQVWNAVTGDTHQIAHYKNHEKSITVPWVLKDLESVFIVFEKSETLPKADLQASIESISQNDSPTWIPSYIDENGNTILNILQNGQYQILFSNQDSFRVEIKDIPKSIKLDTPWQLTFQEDRDVEKNMELAQLTSLTKLKPLALKHYSGSVKYQNEFQFSADLLRNDCRWLLDLGEVGVIAKVKVNGKYFGELWSRPLHIDITDALHIGNNQLEIEVATTWVNRLVGDLKYPDVFPDSNTTKSFKTELTFESKITQNTELQPAGLIGPVQVKPIKNIKIR